MLRGASCLALQQPQIFFVSQSSPLVLCMCRVSTSVSCRKTRHAFQPVVLAAHVLLSPPHPTSALCVSPADARSVVVPRFSGFVDRVPPVGRVHVLGGL